MGRRLIRTSRGHKALKPEGCHVSDVGCVLNGQDICNHVFSFLNCDGWNPVTPREANDMYVRGLMCFPFPGVSLPTAAAMRRKRSYAAATLTLIPAQDQQTHNPNRFLPLMSSPSLQLPLSSNYPTSQSVRHPLLGRGGNKLWYVRTLTRWHPPAILASGRLRPCAGHVHAPGSRSFRPEVVNRA